MKRQVLALFCAAAAALAAPHALRAQTPPPAQQAPAAKVDVTGAWQMNLEIEMGSATPSLALKQDGGKVTGTYTGRYGEFVLTGTIDDKRMIQFSFHMSAEGTDVTMSFAGEVAADGKTMTKGTCTIEGMGDGTWTATRQK